LTLGQNRSYTALVGRSGRLFHDGSEMTTTTRTRTFSPRPRDIERRWYVVDADGAVLGRLASEVAKILRGKHKPIFAPHADTGDHVIVVNARGVRLTGGKEGEKIYYRHSGYPGGLREIGYDRLLAERPAVAVEKAVKGMLPKNRLGRQMITKLKVYEGAEHPHVAQGPVSLRLGDIPKWEGLPAPTPPKQPKPKAEKPAKPAGPKKAQQSARRSTAERTGTAAGPTARRSSGGPKSESRTGGRRASKASETGSAASGRKRTPEAGAEEGTTASRSRKKKES
jgi:large subunit ribosomal protein L13